MSIYSITGASRRAVKRTLKTVQAVSDIKTLTSSLKQVRENVDSIHSGLKVSKMCNKFGTTPSMTRVCGRQRQASIQTSKPSEYIN